MSERVIYHIEDRGAGYIYHWFFFMLGGLRQIPTDLNRYCPDGGGVFEQNVEKYKSHQPVNTPIFVTMQEQNSKGEALYSDLHKETFNLLKDRYTYVPFNEIKDTDIVINNYGEPVHSDHRGNNFDEGVYHFLKNLFSFETDNSKHKGRRYYISRNKSHNLAGNSGVVRRHIVNEDEFSTLLESYGFEKIYLEDYSIPEKVEIFKNADTIISPNSGGLVFSLYASDDTNIIEINTSNPHQIYGQYEDIADVFSFPYQRFTAEKVDNMDNMRIDIDSFKSILETL